MKAKCHEAGGSFDMEKFNPEKIQRQDSCLQELTCAAGIRLALITFKVRVFKLCCAEL